MTLVITAAAALIAAVVYFRDPAAAKARHVGALALMYLGAALMWCVDGFASVAEGGSFIELADPAAMADDALLGVLVVALGLIVWGAINLVKRRERVAVA